MLSRPFSVVFSSGAAPSVPTSEALAISARFVALKQRTAADWCARATTEVEARDNDRVVDDETCEKAISRDETGPSSCVELLLQLIETRPETSSRWQIRTVLYCTVLYCVYCTVLCVLVES